VGVYARAKAAGEPTSIKRGKPAGGCACFRAFFGFDGCILPCCLRPDVNVRAIPTKPTNVDYRSPALQLPFRRHDAFSGFGYSEPLRAGFSHQRIKRHIHPASGIQNRV
jgi:hypothetical protein